MVRSARRRSDRLYKAMILYKEVFEASSAFMSAMAVWL